MRLKTFLFLSIALLVISAGCISGNITGNSAEKKDALSKCLTEKGAKMYGAYWCQHCQNQKNDFGNAFQYIDYVECDANGPNGNPTACELAGIQGYPTWIIGGAKYSGEQDLSTLAQIAGCEY